MLERETVVMPRITDPNRPRCIVCGKPIAKRYHILWFQKTRDAIPTTPFHNEIAAVIDGQRINGTIYLDNPPTTKDEAQRHSNHPIQRVIGSYNGYISGATYWDGESYIDRFFCKDKCAIKQGYASAHHDQRYVWKDR